MKNACRLEQCQTAIQYYKTRKLSLGKAAELVGMTRFEFIEYLCPTKTNF